MATKRKTAGANNDEPSNDDIDYERTLADLESIVERMEAEQQPLEKAVKDFERGMALSRACLSSLKAAEQRIDKLMLDDTANDDDAAIEPFKVEE